MGNNDAPHVHEKGRTFRVPKGEVLMVCFERASGHVFL